MKLKHSQRRRSPPVLQRQGQGQGTLRLYASLEFRGLLGGCERQLTQSSQGDDDVEEGELGSVHIGLGWVYCSEVPARTTMIQST